MRKPISPRLGTMKSIRTHPAAWLAISSMRPLRAAISCVMAPTNSSGQSMVIASNGSCSLPSMVRVTTCGLPTVSSKPSRRICSTRTASASSPRPCTSHASGRSMSTTLIDTLPISSAVQAALHHSRGQLVPGHLARQRRGVGADRHRDGRLVDGDARQRVRVVDVGQRVADHDLGHARDGDDVAGDGLVGAASAPRPR